MIIIPSQITYATWPIPDIRALSSISNRRLNTKRRVTFLRTILLSPPPKTEAQGSWDINLLQNPIAISNNVYFNCSGPKLKGTGTGGVGSDSSPVFEDPLVTGWTYDISEESPANKDPISFQKIKGDWGPPNLHFPQKGTPPSCSH